MSTIWTHGVCLLSGYCIAKCELFSPWLAAIVVFYCVSDHTRMDQVRGLCTNVLDFMKSQTVVKLARLRQLDHVEAPQNVQGHAAESH